MSTSLHNRPVPNDTRLNVEKIDIAVVMKDYDNFFDTQLELMKLGRGIDSRIEPHPFRTNEFGLFNPLVYEVVKYGFLI
ncbi:MAG: hypothetical protein LBS94_04825 [Prevotellaceae bacterium]|jgi:hypothetical protein|nr:hypothetical protein [Prevotellaceae bacterium]